MRAGRAAQPPLVRALTAIRRWSATYIEVIVPSRRGRIDGVRAYICAGIKSSERDEIDGIPSHFAGADA